ncbi:hypothetical protein BDV33DRAFT_185966 [Aspergillus novoparasiticus]|uniref:Uncharacterized protein n=1 Tax=Aspergillus novoparasiticus TaxID=986946 RepID=A0A5N6E7T6_9EURO|nr:hypothetical protein BDV33DRAFT_185966 [Aspergillus novoparasiticus]
MGISSFQDQLSQVGETPRPCIPGMANLRPRGTYAASHTAHLAGSLSERLDRGYKPKSAIDSWSDRLEGRRGWSRGPMW